MIFSIYCSDYTSTRPNTKKVRAHLTSGIAEIYDQHDILLGKIDLNRLDSESTVEGKTQNSVFLLQKGVLIVSKKEMNSPKIGTYVYVYAQRVQEIAPESNLDELIQRNINKQADLVKQKQKIENDTDKNQEASNRTQLVLINEENEFLEYVIKFVKEWKLNKK